MLVKGSPVPPHTNIVIGVREGASLRRVLEDVRQDDQFDLNEFEDEIVAALVEILEAEPQ